MRAALARLACRLRGHRDTLTLEREWDAWWRAAVEAERAGADVATVPRRYAATWRCLRCGRDAPVRAP